MDPQPWGTHRRGLESTGSRMRRSERAPRDRGTASSGRMAREAPSLERNMFDRRELGCKRRMGDNIQRRVDNRNGGNSSITRDLRRSELGLFRQSIILITNLFSNLSPCPPQNTPMHLSTHPNVFLFSPIFLKYIKTRKVANFVGLF